MPLDRVDRFEHPVVLVRIVKQPRRHATTLERHYTDVCDIEFTIEQGKLWMLQTRIGKRSPQAALRIAVEMAEDDEFPLSRLEAVERVAGHLADPPLIPAERDEDAISAAVGLGASPGVAVGAIVTTPEAAVVTAGAGTDVILVRRETSPDDVHGMARAAGILTTTGGLANPAVATFETGAATALAVLALALPLLALLLVVFLVSRAVRLVARRRR